jgi:hypothetical protein
VQSLFDPVGTSPTKASQPTDLQRQAHRSRLIFDSFTRAHADFEHVPTCTRRPLRAFACVTWLPHAASTRWGGTHRDHGRTTPRVSRGHAIRMPASRARCDHGRTTPSVSREGPCGMRPRRTHFTRDRPHRSSPRAARRMLRSRSWCAVTKRSDCARERGDVWDGLGGAIPSMLQSLR